MRPRSGLLVTVCLGFAFVVLSVGALAPAGALATTTIGSPLIVPASQQLTAIACPTSTNCLAVSNGTSTGVNAVVVPITNGKPGVAIPVPTSMDAPAGETVDLDSIACVSVTTCYAAGELLWNGNNEGAVVTITNGIPSAPEQAGDIRWSLSDIACSDGGTCEAVGSDGGGYGEAIPVTNGIPGPSSLVQQSTYLYSVLCFSGNSCDAFGGTANSTSVMVPISDGTAGTPQPMNTGDPAVSDPAAVACETADSCLVAGSSEGDGELLAFDNGKLSAPVAIPDDVLSGIGCASSSDCIGVGSPLSREGTMAPIIDGTPGTVTIIPSVTSLNGVACPTTTTCEAVGENTDNGVLLPITIGTSPETGSSTGPTPGVQSHLEVGHGSVRRETVSIPISCTGTTPCAGAITETTLLPKRPGHGTKREKTILVHKSYSLAPGSHETISLRPDRNERFALTKARQRKVKLIVTLGTGSSARSIATRSLTLRIA
jgi:hypothetical protein